MIRLFDRWRDRAAGITPGTAVVLLAAFSVFFWAWINFRLPFPYIFADETGFMIPARAIADPGYHPDGGGLRYALRSQSPLHSVLFSLVCASGDGFFHHAKFLNCLLCGLSVFPAYGLARRLASRGPALFFAALVALNPWNSLSAHFMPESLYALLFWLLAWVFVLSLHESGKPIWRSIALTLVLGLVTALLFFTKPHAATIFAACGGALALRSIRAAWSRSPDWWIGLVQAAVFSLVTGAVLAGFAAAADRTLLDVILAGRYQTHARDLFSVEKLGLQFEGILRQSSGHLGNAAVLYTVPFAISLTLFWRGVRSYRPEESRFADFAGFTALMISMTIGLTIKFACDIMLTADPNDIHRLSERYYGFLLPLLALMLLASPWKSAGAVPRVLAALIAVGAAASLILQHTWFQIHPHDAPQYYWLSPAAIGGRPLAWYVWLALGAAATNVLCFVCLRHYDRRAFAITAALVCVASGVKTEQRKWSDSRSAIHFHAFSQMTRQVISNDWRHTIVVGDPGMVSCYLFHLDGLPLTVLLPPDAPLPSDRVPAGTKWIIRVRRHALPDLKTTSVFAYEGNGVFDISKVLP